MKKFALVAFASVLSTSAAFSADLIIPTSAPSVYTDAGFDWSGFYAGVNLGYGWGEAETFGATLDDLDGVLGGAQIGYNYDFGGFVLGVEGDVQLADLNYEETLAGITAEAGIDAFATLRARAGVAVDRFLPYVTGGLAIANGTISATDGVTTIESDDTFVGYAVGAGVEFAAADNITVKAEYLYADFGDADFGTGLDVGLSAHVVRAGVNFKF